MHRDEARGHMALNARPRGQGFMLRAVGSHVRFETGRTMTREVGAAGRDVLDSVRAGRGGSRRLLGVSRWPGGQWAGLEGVGSPERMDECPNGIWG